MNDDGHEKTGARPEKGRDPEANRRWFLRRLAALGGGTIAGWAAMIGAAEAQPAGGWRPGQNRPGGRLRTGPRGRGGAGPPGSGPTLQLDGKGDDGLTPEGFKRAFKAIEATGTVGPKASSQWKQHLAEMTPTDRMAAVMTIEWSQRYPYCDDIAGKAAELIKVMGVGAAVAAVRAPLGGQEPLGFKGVGCVGDKGTGALCGNNCGNSSGGGCGNRCYATQPETFAVDVMGDALLLSDTANCSMELLGAAMANAALAAQETIVP